MTHTPPSITTLSENEIFVFGSNLAGHHFGGAARTAQQWGAILGQGVGLQGRTYAIPTMFKSVAEIQPYVNEFIAFAKQHPHLHFLVTKIGCGIAGFPLAEMAGLFADVVQEEILNISLPLEFVEEMENNKGLFL